MVKRRDLIAELERAGLVSIGGTKHEKFAGNGHVTRVPRHREIDEDLAKEIRKQAGLTK